VGQQLEPFAEEPLDFLLVEAVGDGLGCGGVGAGQQAVVESLESNAAFGQLALEVFMAVDAELAAVGKVGTELEEERPEVLVDTVEVIEVDHRGGVIDPRDGALAIPEVLADGARHGRLFLGDANEDDPLLLPEILEEAVHDVILALALGKAVDGNPLAVGEIKHVAAERLAGLHRVLGRGETVALVVAEIGGHPAGAGQLRHVAVEVHAVNAFQFEGDVFGLQLGDGVWHVHGGVRLDYCYTPNPENTSRLSAQSGVPKGCRSAAPAGHRPPTDWTPPGRKTNEAVPQPSPAPQPQPATYISPGLRHRLVS